MLPYRVSLLCLIACAVAQAQTPREFETASVRRSTSGAQVRMEIDAVRFSARSSTLRSMIKEAYGIEDFQLQGENGWMNGDLYTIAASIPAPSNHNEVMEMLRNLLADRFHLRTHFETRQVKAYELVVDKGGSKLKALAYGEAPAIKHQSRKRADPQRGNHRSRSGQVPQHASQHTGARLAGCRSHRIDRPLPDLDQVQQQTRSRRPQRDTRYRLPL